MTSQEAGDLGSEEELLGLVRTACSRVLELEPASLGADSRFAEDLGADSLALVEIVETVEDRLVQRHGPGLRILDEDLDGLRTVGELVDHVTVLLRAHR